MNDAQAIAEDDVADSEAHQEPGDGDFEQPLKPFQARVKRFMVMSTKRFIARELREVSGMHFVDFEDIRGEVQKEI